MDTAALAEGVLRGDVRSVARAISLVEDGRPEAAPLLAALFPHAGRGLILGITGPPGAGKSTLVDRITAHLRKQGKTVGIVAVDPTSPYTGGAILGDRIRMQAHAVDEGVFIRSMATRGHLGGLAAATGHVLTVLAASGKDVIVVETVGVGQDEVEIVGTADVSVVVLVPGLGDEVQALKAGIMEIADIFVVNKADREGVDRVVAEIQGMLSLSAHDAERPEIVKTVATTDEGIAELLLAVEAFQSRAEATGLLQKKQRSHLWQQFEQTLQAELMARVLSRALPKAAREAWVDRLARREIDPFTAADEVLSAVGLTGNGERPGSHRDTEAQRPEKDRNGTDRNGTGANGTEAIGAGVTSAGVNDREAIGAGVTGAEALAPEANGAGGLGLHPSATGSPRDGIHSPATGSSRDGINPLATGSARDGIHSRRETEGEPGGETRRSVSPHAMTPPPHAMKIDHLGIAVPDMAAAIQAYEALGFTVEKTHDVPTEKVKTAFLPIGESHLELLEPTDPGSVIAKFLQKRSGLHHVCILVNDIEATMAQMRARGVLLLDEAPRIGAGGCRVAFIHPRSAGGVLLELKEA